MKRTKKLVLTTEKIRALRSADLANANGGWLTETRGPSCSCNTGCGGVTDDCLETRDCTADCGP